MIEEHHPVRFVSTIIDEINIDFLLSDYSKDGASSYHPKMMLKVWIFSYLNNIYSTRKVEAFLKENIHAMWLSGMQTPDHNTLSRFRSGKLKNHIKKVFFKIVQFLVDEDQLDLCTAYTDGTKIESVANKYTFVWGKRIRNAQLNIAKALEELWDYTEELTTDEFKQRKPTSFAPVSSEGMLDLLGDIEEELKDKPIPKKIKDKINYAKKKQAPKIDEYKAHEELLDGRNSYSKTDVEATFMKMKDDPMKNGQLKPAYNVQVSTENEYALNYSVHQTPGDSTTFIEHHQQIKEGLENDIQIAVADSGYGSEENYTYLEENDIENLVKYAGLHQELRSRKKEGFKFTPNSFYINEKENIVVCPMGQRMDFIGIKKQKSSTGFQQEIHQYTARNCKSCPLHSRCFTSKYKDKNKVLSVNLKAKKYREKAKENLTSKDGEILRKKRCAEVEQFFGQMKSNKKFKRFLMKGIDKVSIELGLLFIGMNIHKWSRKVLKQSCNSLNYQFERVYSSNLQISA